MQRVMSLITTYLFGGLWLAFVIYFVVAAINTKLTSRSESVRSRAMHVVPFIIGFSLFFIQWPLIDHRLWRLTPVLFWISAGITGSGLAFSALARHWLGSNWSGIVTVKESHTLVRKGPYGKIRHPLYTGLLIAVLGTCIAFTEWQGFIALAIISLALWRKLRVEEQWMQETFKSEYEEYKSNSWALFPFII